MLDLSHRVLLLAQRNRFGNLSEEFRASGDSAGRQELLLTLMLVAGLVAGVWLLSRWLGTGDKHRVCNRPWRLFLELCRAHGLSWSDRWLLWKVAKSQRLKDPGRIFLEPERLDRANLGPAFRVQAGRLQAIRERLFAECGGTEPCPPKKRHQEGTKQRSSSIPLLPPAPAPALDVPPWTPVGAE